MQIVDRIDAITELYALGEVAEKLIMELAAAQDRATFYRLNAMPGNAQFESREAAMLAAELERIGKRQTTIIAQLTAAGEVIYP